MLSRFRGHVRHNVVAYLALFVALGGTSAWATHETILSSDIVDGEVKTPDLGTSAVTAAKLGTSAVTAPKIATGAVTGPKLAASAVTSDKVATNAITNAKLATNAVTTLKLAPSAVTSDKLAPNAVTNAKLAAGAVTPGKFGTIPAARAEKTATQSIPNATEEEPFTALTFETEAFDTAALHDTAPANNALLSAPIAGVYQVTAGVGWADNATGDRTLVFGVGSSPFFGGAGASSTKGSSDTGVGTLQTASTLVKLAAGEDVVVFARQNSGSAQSIAAGDDTFLAMHWVGPG